MRFADYEWAVSAVTLGELRLGVLQARGPDAAARRLSTYQLAATAIAQGVPVVTQDSDYDAMPDLEVIRL